MRKTKRQDFLFPILMIAVLAHQPWSIPVAGAAATPADRHGRPLPCECEPEQQLSLTEPWQRGEDVRGLQEYLRKLGYDPGSVDGVYGPTTAAAVKEFQRHRRIKPDGITNATTWAALGQSAIGRTKASATRDSRIELVVDLHLTLLVVLDRGKIIAVFPVALGKTGKPTPVGNFRVTAKAEWGGGFGTRWMGLDVPWGIYGIHGTNKPWTIGTWASSGCVRMFNADVERVYDLVSVGTPVHIIGDPFYGTAELGPGETGASVQFLQRRLVQLGYYRGQADGHYGIATERAVMAFQKVKGLEATGRVSWEEIKALRLVPLD